MDGAIGAIRSLGPNTAATPVQTVDAGCCASRGFRTSENQAHFSRLCRSFRARGLL
jgi:hypothetical protein